VDSEEEAVAVLKQTVTLDRRRVRRRFEERFPASRMAADYVAIYEKLLQQPIVPGRRWAASGAARTERGPQIIN
jgi:hypothetical protein